MTALPLPKLEHIYTADQFETMPEFDDGYELVEGRLVKKPMPNQEHSLIAYTILKHYILFDPTGEKGQILQEISTRLNISNVPAPDVAFWTIARKPKRSQSAATPPDLAIEVGSPRDWETKKRQAEARAKVPRYLDNGVQVVWIINPKKQQVEVYRPNQPVQMLEKSDTLTVEDLIPGFSLPVALLFEGD